MAFEDTDRQILPCLPPRLDKETQRSECHFLFASKRALRLNRRRFRAKPKQ
jgi:hypothetical protein